LNLTSRFLHPVVDRLRFAVLGLSRSTAVPLGSLQKEYQMAISDHFDTVQEIYIGFYQRPADPAGLRYWSEQIEAAGGDAAAVIDAFANSEEAGDVHGDINQDTIGGVIDAIYNALFDRAPEPAGKAYLEA